MAVFVRLAIGIREASGPFLYDSCFYPAFDEVLEALAPDGEELGPVVESSFSDATGRHAATDAPAFVQHGDAPSGVLQFAGGEEARNARPDHHA